ncbi:hypothetical protein AB0L13_44815 [Saccharopolyspora shandongensis]|uniref:hypothetical protein n=1 Tax=Saccharopolyspora shandongensis TaxID=418495 RepID=UPI003413A183
MVEPRCGHTIRDTDISPGASVQPDLAVPQQTADLGVRNGQVCDDRQHLLQQVHLVHVVLRPLGQLLLDLALGAVLHLRQVLVAPDVIKTLEFRGGDGSADLLTATDILRNLYVCGGRNVPTGAPTSFVPAHWQGYLSAAEEDKNTITYRHYWEHCACCSPCASSRSTPCT